MTAAIGRKPPFVGPNCGIAFQQRHEGYDNGSAALVALGETAEAERVRSMRHAEQ